MLLVKTKEGTFKASEVIFLENLMMIIKGKASAKIHDVVKHVSNLVSIENE